MVEIGKETDRPHGSRPACRAGGEINRGIHVDYGGVRQVPDGFRGKRALERLARQLVRHSRVDAVDVLACGPPRHPHVFDGERVVVEAVELGAKRFEPPRHRRHDPPDRARGRQVGAGVGDGLFACANPRQKRPVLIRGLGHRQPLAHDKAFLIVWQPVIGRYPARVDARGLPWPRLPRVSFGDPIRPGSTPAAGPTAEKRFRRKTRADGRDAYRDGGERLVADAAGRHPRAEREQSEALERQDAREGLSRFAERASTGFCA